VNRHRADLDDVLHAARAGAAWAHSHLFAAFAPLVLHYLQARNAPDPEDLTNEVFLSALTSIHTFTGDHRRFPAWLITIARRRLADELRRRYRQPATEPLGTLPDQPAGDDVATTVARRLATRHVVTLCAELPGDQRAVMIRRLLGGHTIHEIATALDKSTGAVKALQRRALRSLEQRLRHTHTHRLSLCRHRPCRNRSRRSLRTGQGACRPCGPGCVTHAASAARSACSASSTRRPRDRTPAAGLSTTSPTADRRVRHATTGSGAARLAAGLGSERSPRPRVRAAASVAADLPAPGMRTTSGRGCRSAVS
jgi:RNA polymerase sigma factor (sigma-70 family)